MAKKSVTVTVHIDGLRTTLAAFRDLPKDASARLREASLKLAEKLAVAARAEGMADEDPRSPLLATTVKAVKDRVPAVQAGGSTRLGRHRAPAYAMLFGSMFGMNKRSGWYAASRYRSADGHQYREHRGTEAYWFFPVVERKSDEIGREWNQAAQDIARDFGRG